MGRHSKDLLSKLCNPDVFLRYSAKIALQHPWLAKYNKPMPTHRWSVGSGSLTSLQDSLTTKLKAFCKSLCYIASCRIAVAALSLQTRKISLDPGSPESADSSSTLSPIPWPDRESENDWNRARFHSGDTETGSRVMGKDLTGFKLRLVRIGPDKPSHKSPQVAQVGLSPIQRPRERCTETFLRETRYRFFTDARDLRSHLPDCSFILPQERNRGHERYVSVYQKPTVNRTFLEVSSPIAWDKKAKRHPYQPAEDQASYGSWTPSILPSHREVAGNPREQRARHNRIKPPPVKSRQKHAITKSALPPIRRSHNESSFHQYLASRVSHGD